MEENEGQGREEGRREAKGEEATKGHKGDEGRWHAASFIAQRCGLGR